MADVDEKTKKARAERREKLLAWYEEKDLPPVIGDYELRIIDEQHDRIYYAFGWFHKSNGWKIRVLYDEETADYMVKMDLHMITLTEIECITGDLEEFKRLVKLLSIARRSPFWARARASWSGTMKSCCRRSSGTMCASLRRKCRFLG